MKKLLAVLLALAMLLNMTGVLAQAADEKVIVEYDEALSFAFIQPEGYSVEQEIVNGHFFLSLVPEDETKASVDLMIAPMEDEVLGNLERLNDLDEEQLNAFIADITVGYNAPETQMVETEAGTHVLVISENDSDMDFAELVSIYHGYFIFAYIGYADNTQVTEDDVNAVIWFFSNLDFVE